MSKTLELYKRIGEKPSPYYRETPEKKAQKEQFELHVYHKNGMEWIVKSVKLAHAKTINGKQGKPTYAITFDDGITRFYPREEIVGIIPKRKES